MGDNNDSVDMQEGISVEERVDMSRPGLRDRERIEYTTIVAEACPYTRCTHGRK